MPYKVSVVLVDGTLPASKEGGEGGKKEGEGREGSGGREEGAARSVPLALTEGSRRPWVLCLNLSFRSSPAVFPSLLDDSVRPEVVAWLAKAMLGCGWSRPEIVVYGH